MTDTKVTIPWCIENTGNFEGWAKVNRKIVTDETKKVARVKLPTVSEVLRVMYCIGDGTTCTPDSQYKFADGATQVTVEKTINKGQVLCAYEEYPENGVKKTTSNMCQTFDSANVSTNGYAYDVIITIKDRDRAVNSFNFSENTTKEEFYGAIDRFKEEAKNKTVNPMAIASPTCNIDDVVTYKGTTTIKNQTTESTTTTTKKNCKELTPEEKTYEIILNPNGGVLGTTIIKQCVDCGSSVDIEIPTREGYTFDGWYYDKAFSKRLVGNASSRVEKQEKIGADNCVYGYDKVYLYAKWQLDESKTTTTEIKTTTPNSTAESDKTSIKTTEENEVTLKTFYKEKDYIRLQPENDKLSPIILSNCIILGKAIGIYRKL